MVKALVRVSWFRRAAIAAGLVVVQLGSGFVLAKPALAAAPPGQPTFVEAEQVAGGVVEVIWDAPSSDGGSPLTSYTATASPGGASCTTTDTVLGHEICDVSGLTVGVSYTFTVVATNALGTSAPSAASPPVLVQEVPGAPVITGLSDAGNAVGVSWTAASNTGPPMVGYVAIASPGGNYCTTTTGLSCSIGGLFGGTYSFTVIAVNDAGEGAPSADFGPVAFTVPAAPTSVVATVIDATTSLVTWTPGLPQSFHPATYLVTASPGGSTCGAPVGVNSCQVTGLFPGTSYTFTVAGTNQVGVGPSSSPSAPLFAAPRAISSATVVGEIASDGTVGARISYAVPSSNTVRVAVVQGTAVPPATQIWPFSTPNATGVALRRLRAGVPYTIAIYVVTPFGVASAPTVLHVTGTTASLTRLVTSTAGGVVSLRATLTNFAGVQLSGRRLTILSQSGRGDWKPSGVTYSGPRGAVTLRVKPTVNTLYALRFAGESDTLGFTRGGSASVRVAARVTARLSLVRPVRANTVRARSAALLTGTVSPAKPGQVVLLQVLVGKVWRNVRSAKLNSRSTFSFVLPTGSRGTARYRVLRPADAANIAGASAVQVLTVI